MFECVKTFPMKALKYDKRQIKHNKCSTSFAHTCIISSCKYNENAVNMTNQ
jgi:hypothetical protein